MLSIILVFLLILGFSLFFRAMSITKALATPAAAIVALEVLHKTRQLLPVS